MIGELTSTRHRWLPVAMMVILLMGLSLGAVKVRLAGTSVVNRRGWSSGNGLYKVVDQPKAISGSNWFKFLFQIGKKSGVKNRVFTERSGMNSSSGKKSQKCRTHWQQIARAPLLVKIKLVGLSFVPHF